MLFLGEKERNALIKTLGKRKRTNEVQKQLIENENEMEIEMQINAVKETEVINEIVDNEAMGEIDEEMEEITIEREQQISKKQIKNTNTTGKFMNALLLFTFFVISPRRTQQNEKRK